MDDIIHYKLNDSEEDLEALKEEGRKKYVTLEDVGFTLLEIIDSVTSYTDFSQAVTEVRLKAIVQSLPEEVKRDILNRFREVDDDLFEDEGENNKDE